jgi:hypothetical protein
MSDKTHDELAAEMAASGTFEGFGPPLEKGGASGDMPTSRPGTSGAEGGFTPEAGGQVIDAGVESGVEKGGAKTGTAMNSEPGAQNVDRNTGSAITDEPGRQGGGGAGDGGNLSQSGDGMRARKPGQIGVSGGSTGGGNLSEDEDDKMRGRKAGKVGITKSQAEALGLNQAQFNALGDLGLVQMEKGGDENNEEEEEEKACKSDLDADDLVKAMETLEQVAGGSVIAAPPDRRQELGDKLSKGEISVEEMGELQQILVDSLDPMEKGAAPAPAAPAPAVQDELHTPEPDPDLERSYQEQFAEDETMAEGYDVSPFLERQNQLNAAALDQIGARLEKSLQEQAGRAGQFNIQLAKSLTAQAHVIKGQESMIKSQGEVIQGLANRLEHVENTPLPRRGVTNLSTLNKAMPGEAGQGQGGPTPDQVMDTLLEMAKSKDSAPCGEPLMKAVALFESSGSISRSLMEDVVTHMRSGQSIH